MRIASVFQCRLSRAGFALSALWLAAMPAFGVVSSIAIKDEHLNQAFMPRRLTLLIGIGSFADEKYRPLQYPQKDVTDFRTFLSAHNQGEHDREIVLLDDGAKLSNVTGALDDLERLNTSEDDIIVVYLSTHGTLAQDAGRSIKRYVVLNDTMTDAVTETGLAVDYIESRLARLKSSRKALILALCHSGSGKSQLPQPLEDQLSSMKAEFFPQPLHEASSAMMVLSASSWGQAAREDNGLQNDIYTHFLLQGLDKNDVNGDGAVSLFEAHEFARSRTYDFTRGQQTPTALINLTGMDPIILNGQVRKRTEPLVFADNDQFRNLQVMVDGRSKGTLWNPQKLKEGRVRLTLVDPRTPDSPLMDHHIFLQNDHSYPVSALFRRPPALGVEMQAFNMPLPTGWDGLGASDFWSPGIAVRSTDVLGSRYSVGAGVFHRRLEGESVADNDTAVDLQVTMFRGVLGLGLYPRPDGNITPYVAVEHLRVERTVANAAFENASQTAAVTVPAVGVEARMLQIVGSVYAGAFAQGYPARKMGLPYDGGVEPLRSWSLGGVSGLSF